MKVPSDRRRSSDHYAPYPSTSPEFAHPGNPPMRGTPSSAGGDEGTQYKVARAISSCTRCRSRKQKCDGKLPACSACERAKVECIGFDAISKTNVSRNYLHSLEQEVTSLRAQVAALTDRNNDHIGNQKRSIAAGAHAAIQSYRPSDGLVIDPSLVGGDGDSTPIRSPWDSPGGLGAHQRRHSDFPFPSSPLSLESPRSSYAQVRSNSTGIPGVHNSSLGRMVHDAALRTGHASNKAQSLNTANGQIHSGSDHGSARGHESPATAEGDGPAPSPDHLPTPKSGNTGLSTTSPNDALDALSTAAASKKPRQFAIPPLPPQPAVERLVAAYVDFVGVTAPIIHIPTLGKQLIKIREARDVEESDVFVVMMVLALSTMASSRFVDPPDELRAVSEAFHSEAMKHLDAVFEGQGYVGLQAILLLVWYALLNPDKGSVWFLVGLAVRTCVDLGFHNENNAASEQLDALELDMRRRLFWITYKMDRLLCIGLGRPPSIPDGFINVPLPSPLHDVDIHAGQYGTPTGDACSYKAVFLHTIKCRQLQSEILNNTFGIYGTARGIPTPEWFENCFNQIKDWLANAPEPRGTVSAEGYAISFHNTALLLCRPSSGNPRPDRNALATVLASSSYIIRIYRRMQLNNRISWLWMTSHFTFMAGLSFLYAYFNLYNTGTPGVPTLDEAMMDIESAMAVLEYLSPRVPSAGACHDTMQTVSQAILDQIQKTQKSSSQASSPRGNIRSAPISSSRDDPLPSDGYPAPLPQVAMPYELTLLDNLFRNPMAAHSKASDYTNGKRAGDLRLGMTIDPQFTGGAFNNGAPQGFPPSAFQNSFVPNTGLSNMGGLGAYGMAAQVGTGIPQIQTPIMGMGGTGAGGGDISSQINANMVQNGGHDQTVGANTNFDVFSFLMDEEGLGGTASWDAMEMPTDFSLWS